MELWVNETEEIKSSRVNKGGRSFLIDVWTPEARRRAPGGSKLITRELWDYRSPSPGYRNNRAHPSTNEPSSVNLSSLSFPSRLCDLVSPSLSSGSHGQQRGSGFLISGAGATSNLFRPRPPPSEGEGWRKEGRLLSHTKRCKLPTGGGKKHQKKHLKKQSSTSVATSPGAERCHPGPAELPAPAAQRSHIKCSFLFI